jgi:glutaredoxin
VYSREYCHLCDDMIAALRILQNGSSFAFDVIDVDSDPALEARFGEKVPVIVAGDDELCHYHLNVAKVNEYLGKIR